MTETPATIERDEPSYDAGRRAGLATAALVLSLVSFISLLGLEKATTAILLAALALRGGAPARAAARPARLSKAAIAVALVYVITWVVLLMVYWDDVLELIRQLQQLS